MKTTTSSHNWHLSTIINILFFLLLFSCGSQIFAETEITIEWEKTFGGDTDDIPQAIIQTTDGELVVAGSTELVNSDNYESVFWVIGLDSSGNQKWHRVFGWLSDARANSIIQTTDGGFAVAGINDSDAWIIKLDSSKNQEWEKTLVGDGIDNYIAQSITQTKDGGFAVAGYTELRRRIEDSWVIKLDSKGNQEWKKTFWGGGLDSAHSIIQTTDGGFAVAASMFLNRSDALVIKLDSTGNQEWEKTFGEGFYDAAHSIIQTTDGGFAVAGNNSSRGNDENFWVIKLDGIGNQEWEKTFWKGNSEEATSIIQTKDGGYVIAGYTSSQLNGDFDFLVMKLDATGNQKWKKTFGGNANESAASIIQTKDGGFAVAGYTESKGAGKKDYWVIKLKTKTNKLCDLTTTSPVEKATFNINSLGQLKLPYVRLEDQVLSVKMTRQASDPSSYIFEVVDNCVYPHTIRENPNPAIFSSRDKMLSAPAVETKTDTFHVQLEPQQSSTTPLEIGNTFKVLSAKKKLAEGSRKRLLAGTTYVKTHESTLELSNPLFYTGIFIQFDKNSEVVGVDLIGGSDTAWFASQFLDPFQWKSSLWNFYEQSKALFKWEIDEMSILQQHKTTVEISQFAHSSKYYIGGWVSLVVDAMEMLMVVADQSSLISTKHKKGITLRIVKQIINDNSLILAINRLVEEGETAEAFGYVLYEFIEIMESYLIDEVIKDITKNHLYTLLEKKYGLTFAKTAAGRIVAVGEILDGLQLFAHGVDAGVKSFNYYNDSSLPLLEITIPISEL